MTGEQGRLSCAEFAELGPELATGSLSGDERARALQHLRVCGRCGDLLDDLARLADGLLLLGPSVEPPPGFEQRVLARASTEGLMSPPAGVVALAPSPRRRRWPALAAAAAVALVAAAGAVVVGSPGGGPGPASAVRIAEVRGTGGLSVCRALAYPAHPTRLMVSVDEPAAAPPDDYVVEVQPTGDRPPVALGTLHVAGGHGTLGAASSLRPEDLRSVRVLEGDSVVYEAPFHS